MARFDYWLLISIFWHLCWFSAVGVVVTPEKEEENFTVVSFLGSILDETNFKVTEETPGPAIKQVDSSHNALTPVIAAPERQVSESVMRVLEDKKTAMVPFGGSKENPADVSPPEEARGLKAPEFEIEGPAAERRVMYKPALPAYPKWAEEAGLVFDLTLKFSVNQVGEVMLVETLVSSGYPQIDATGMRYLKNWLFNPLSPGYKTITQWGKINIKFRLESNK